MSTNPGLKNSVTLVENSVKFIDIFNLEDIQRLQDLFSDTNGVASIITHPDGSPITNPSNFCRLCNDIIRKTEKGCANCFKSDAELGRHNPSGPLVQPCLSGGLWDAGVSISVGGIHIGNWLIGQIQNEEVDEQRMLKYADEICANREDFLMALAEVPVMSVKQFKKVSEMLFAFANELSEKAYTNLQLKRQMVERGKAITELKQREETLVKLKKAIYTSGEAIFLTDREGVFTFINPAFTSLYGFSSDDIVGKTTPRIIKSGVLDNSVYEVFWQTILNGKEIRGELINKRKDETLITIESSATPIFDEEKRIIGFLGIQRNITERKLAEQALIIANKEIAFQIEEKEKRAAELIIAEESDRLKTSFLNNISHEIRTPFNSILGFLSLMQDDGLTAGERDEFTDIINKSAYRLMNTINDIVEISQIQAGQIKLTASTTDISRLTDELYDRFTTDAKIKGLEFSVNNDLPNDVECIYTDCIKLNSILYILIGNAIKFSITGSIVFGFRKNADYLEFSVKDTGVGISENKLSKIFERFVQVDGSSTRQFEGSGLGLSIAKAYVELLGGKIWVESEEGKGSIFYFTIPFNTEPKEKKVVENDVPSDKANNKNENLKILIVEDDETSEMLLTMSVIPISREVLKARTGFEAVEACHNNPDIDLILMDLQMPEMNGYEATRQIRKFNKEVVIIAQTAYALTSDREKAIEEGCNDYISKPIKKDELLALIQKYFNK